MLLFFNLQGSNKRFVKMPRKIAVPPEESIPVVKRFMKQFEIEPLPAWSAKVWKEMSIALGKKWSAAACYTNVRNDRNSILSIARQEMGVFAPSKLDHNNNLSIESSMSTVQFDSDESYTDLSIEENRFLDTFDLVLTDQQWNAIKPDIECSSRAKLKPGMWTNEIAISFFKQYRLPCAFVFKRAEVILSQNDIYTIKITGSCKSKKCRNTFRGYAEKEIGVEGLRVQITTRDTRTENHEVVKRPLNGKRRKEVQKELKAEGSSEWRKRQAREIMRPNKTERPILPSGDVLRQAHKKGVDADLGVKENDSRDLVRTIEEMSLKPQYIGLIHDVGSLPFHVCYSTQAQLHAYKEYCRLNKNKSVISLDSTGSVVQRLDRKSQKSGHIFLYAIVINFDNTTISVYQMLSEKHTTEFIELWLRQLLRMGAPKPKQVVCDFSRALLCGISLAFNNQTIKSYVDDSFNAILRPNRPIKRPDTIIRVDVAHLIAAACRWNCWKSVRHNSIKEFYVRCIALMVECVSFSDFQKIFYLTCVVGLQTYQDVEIDYSEILTAKDARKKLEGEIAVRAIKVNFDESAGDEPEHSKAQAMTECNELNQNSSSIGDWVDEQVGRAKKKQRDGEELNPFFLPEFVNILSLRVKEFPLWTSVGMDCSTHATSSYVESYFNDIKTRILKTGPMRVDKFLIKHANDIHGATLLFSSNMINYNANRCVHNTDLMKKQENKINKSQPKQSYKLHSTPKDTEQNRSESTSESERSFNDLLEQSTELKTEVNKENMCFDESISKITENKRKILHDIAKLIEPNGEEKMHFNQSASNKLDNLIKSPEQPVILKKYEHTEDKSCPVEMSPNNIEDQSCDSNLLTNKNWQENIETNELDCLNLDFNIDDVSNFIEMPSNDIESYLDSDLLATENWRGKVNINNNNFDYDDFNEESVNDHIVSDIAPSLTGFRELEIINIKSSNEALLDHSYSLMNSSITDLVSPIIDQQNNNFIESKNNLKGESESNYIPSTHLISRSKEQPQACHRKSKKGSKYFKAYPEVSQINALIGQRKKSALLPHGSLLPPIKIKENKGEINSYFVTNTCPFDSLIHVLMTGAIDDINYQAFLKASSNPTLQLVFNLVQKGVTQYVLRQRVLILKNYYNCTPQVQTDLRIVSYTIDSFDSIANMTKNILTTEPSIQNTKKCTGCNVTTFPTVILGPNHKIIAKEGFSSLEKALGFRSPIYKIRCCDPCLGKYTWFREPRIHIFIELDIRPNIQCKIGLNCRVEQLPTTLKFQSDEDKSFEYRLAGVIAYISGHYIAYCLRSNGIWQIYDDLRANISTCSSKTIINPHLAVYLRKH